MAKGKEAPKAKGPAGKRALYEVKGNQLVRKKRACPKCGAGVFLAEHKDRASCGSCGYTEFKKAAA